MIAPARGTPLRLAAAIAAASVLTGGSLSAQQVAVPDDVAANVRARVDAGWTPGIVIGVVDSGGVRYFAHGSTAVADGGPIDERTVYEIGSITKVFTGVLLADLAVHGEVGLDDPPIRRSLRRHTDP